MLILKYFKHGNSKSWPSTSVHVLPYATRPLSSLISPRANTLAKKQVADIIDVSDNSKQGSRGPYQTLMLAQQLLVV